MARTEYHRVYAQRKRERVKELEEENERLKAELDQSHAQIIDLSQKMKQREKEITVTLDEEMDIFHDRLLSVESACNKVESLVSEIPDIRRQLDSLKNTQNEIVTRVDQHLKSMSIMAENDKHQIRQEIRAAVDQQEARFQELLGTVHQTVDQQGKRFESLMEEIRRSVGQQTAMMAKGQAVAEAKDAARHERAFDISGFNWRRGLVAFALVTLIGLFYFFIVEVSVNAYKAMGLDFPPIRTLVWEASIAVCFIIALWPSCSIASRRVFAGLAAIAIAYTLYTGGAQIYRQRTTIADQKRIEYENRVDEAESDYVSKKKTYDDYLKNDKEWLKASEDLESRIKDLQTKYDYVLYNKMSYEQWQASSQKSLYKIEADRLYGRSLDEAKGQLAQLKATRPSPVASPAKRQIPEPQIKTSVLDEILLQIAYFGFILAFKWILIHYVIFSPGQRTTQKSSDKLEFSMNS